MAEQAVAGEISESLAEHFITSRPLENQEELAEFCQQLENSTFLDSMVGGLHLVCTVYLSGSLRFEAQYLLLVMKHKGTLLTLLYVMIVTTMIYFFNSAFPTNMPSALYSMKLW